MKIFCHLFEAFSRAIQRDNTCVLDCTVPSQCRQRFGSGGAISSPSSRCRTGMAAHPAPAPPPVRRTRALQTAPLAVAASRQPLNWSTHRPPEPIGGAHSTGYFGRLWLMARTARRQRRPRSWGCRLPRQAYSLLWCTPFSQRHGSLALS